MSSTENRVVNMQFNNQQFMKGAADSSKALSDLDRATAAAGSSKGLMDLSGQMDQVSISASKMQVASVAAIGTIAAKATALGLNVLKGLTFDPIGAGFKEYEENLNKLNTIMNATGQSEQRVQGILNELNAYSDKTIYSFSNMTTSIQKFVNAGVPLGDSVEAIRGIANAAAYSGATTEEANRAMFAFSQTMGTGFMMLNDWQQIENANMGTIKFKQTLIDTAVAQGKLTKQGNMYITESGKAISATQGWREGLQEQWATTDVVTASLAKYTDMQTKLGRAATESAMEYRTFSAFFDSFKESLGSGWAKIFTALIGGLDDATAFWTGLADAINGVVGRFFEFAEITLKTWRDLGGFEKTMQGFKNILAPIGAILGVVGKALAAAFPSGEKGAGKALYGLSAGFEAVTRPLMWFAQVIEGTTPVLTTFFRLIHIIGSTIMSAGGTVADFVKDLLGMANIKAPSTGGFIDFIKSLASAVSDAIKKVDELIRKGASIGSAMGTVVGDFEMPDMPKMPSMPDMPSMPKLSMPSFGGGEAAGQVAVMKGAVSGLSVEMSDLKKASDSVTKSGMFQSQTMKSAGDSVKSFADDARSAGSGIMNSGDEIKSMWQSIIDTIGPIVGKIKDFIAGISADDVMSAFNMAVFSTMAIKIAQFMHALSGVANIGAAFEGVLQSAGGALDSFQKQAQAKLILNIGIAIGILAASIFLLSTIPADKMATAMAGLTGIVVLMTVTMKQMGKVIEDLDGKKVNLKMIALSIALGALGFAMMELAIAMKILDSVDMDGVAKGLGTMFITMKLVQSLGSMAASSAKSMVGGAAAIAIIAGAMVVLAGALLLFKLVDWGSMAKAGVALLGLTLAVGALALIPYAGISKVGLALLGASVGMLAIANALILFGFVKWESIAKAGVVLLGLTLALGALMMVAQPISVGMFLALGASMLYLSFALKNLNDVEWSSIGKMALVLGILIVAVIALSAAMLLLAPVIPILALFAVALLALGAALFLFAAALSIAMALAAGGTAAFAALATGAAVAIAVFFQTLAHEAPLMKKAFLKILEELIDGVVKAVPMIIDGIKRLWDAVVKELGGGGGGTGGAKGAQMNAAGGTWITRLAEGIKEKIPEIVKKGSELLVSFLTSLRSKAGEIAEAGVGLLVALINGISRKVGDLVDAAFNLVIKFAEGVRKNVNKLIDAGVTMIADFLHALADTIRNGSREIGGGIADVVDAFGDVGRDLVQGMINGLWEMKDDLVGTITDLVGGLPGWAKKLLGESSPSKVFYDIGKFLVMGLTNGIQDRAATAIQAVSTMMTGQIAMADDLMNKFINKLDQRSLAARGKAQGLAAAAKRAQAAANKTKGKENRGDDQAANRLSAEARRADKAADAAEKRAKAERAAEARKKQWAAADELGKARIRSENAKRALASSKQAERDAEAARVEANALMRQSRAADVTAKQRRQFRAEANRLRKQARDDAEKANSQLKKARDNAAEAMEWQQKAGKTASESYQEQFEAEAKAAQDAKDFEKLTAAEKAKRKQEEAAAQEALAKQNLAKAKELAYTDVKAANELAALAMEQAARARELMDAALEYQAEGGSGQVVNLQPTEAASLAFNEYADLYNAAYAAAAGGNQTVFNQYNTSPESLGTDEIYRQSNNLLTFAAEKVSPSAA